MPQLKVRFLSWPLGILSIIVSSWTYPGAAAGQLEITLLERPGSVLRTLGLPPGPALEVLQYTPATPVSAMLGQATEGGRSWHAGKASTALPLIFPEGPPDWLESGQARVAVPESDDEYEVVQYAEIVGTGILLPEGLEVYELRGLDRGLGKWPPREFEQRVVHASKQRAGAPVGSAYLIDADNVFDAVGELLTGAGEAGINGPYSEAQGLGLFETMIDTDELQRLASLPTITGPRLRLIDATTTAASVIAGDLVAEGYCLVPAFVGTSYKLTARRLGLPGPGSVVHTEGIDWPRKVAADGGLGHVVNVIKFELEDGDGTYTDAASQASLRTTQDRSIRLSQQADVAQLVLLEGAAGRIFRLWGLPATLVQAPLGPTGRPLLPGDFVQETLGKSGKAGTWLVLTAAPCWVPGQEAQRVLLLLLPSIAVGWYAPSAVVASLGPGPAELTLEPAAYSSGQSAVVPWTAARDVHHFLPECDVLVFDDEDYAGAVERTIVAVDFERNVLELNTTSGITPGKIIRYSARASCSTTAQARYLFAAPPGSTWHAWGD